MTYRPPTKAVITDAGLASRYLPITKTIPKAMLPLGRRPIMQFVVEECVSAGIEEVIIVASSEGKPIYEDYFNNSVNRARKQLASQGKSKRYDTVQHVLDFPKIIVIEQDSSYPYGNGSPIASAAPYIRDNEAFIALYSDDVVFHSSDVRTLIQSYQRHPDAKAIIISQETPPEKLSQYGVIRLKDSENMLLHDIVEKPNIEDAPSNLVSYGRYLLTPEVFQYLNPHNTGFDNELWTVDAITKLAQDGAVYVEKTKGHWMTTGDPKNYFLTHLQYILENEDYAQDVRNFIKTH